MIQAETLQDFVLPKKKHHPTPAPEEAEATTTTTPGPTTTQEAESAETTLPVAPDVTEEMDEKIKEEDLNLKEGEFEEVQT